LTAERVEEQTAEEAAPSTDTAAEVADTTEAPATNGQGTTTTDADATTAQAEGTADTSTTADAEAKTAEQATAEDQPAPAAEGTVDQATAEDEPAPAAEATADEAPAEEGEQAADPAAQAGPISTADPSPEAAIGASGARPLGDAEEIAAKADDAVERMAAQASDDDASPAAEATVADDADAPAAEAPAADAPADAVGAQADDGQADAAEGDAAEGDGAQADAAQAEASAAPRRKVPEGPEPTTMEELLNEQEGEIRSLKHGDVVEGTVVRIDKDEILVDIGAKSEGVVSNRELYGRNAETQPKLNIGDTVLVYVLQPESPEGHAVLSLRRAGLERKWRSMQEQLDAGTIIEAPVIDHNKGGLIVDCGIRGFVPISQIVDFPRRPQNEQPRDAAQEIAEKLQPYVGRKLRLKILEVNRKANRLILSEKVALYEERREKRDELFSSLQVGQKVTGTVRSIAPFGVFIDLGGIDGLVHKSELSWNKVNNPEAGYKIGEEVEAEVIDINHERGRISLSIRRLQPDPWHSSVADMKVGDVIDGAVTKIVNFGAFVRVRDGLEGLIHISELSHQRVVHPGDVVHEGQRLKLKVISLDSERHRLGLSLKQAEEDPAPRPERERRPRQERGPNYDPSQAVQEPEGGIDNTLAAAFAQVRQQMEETEAARRTDDDGSDAAGEAQPAEGAEPAEAVLEDPPEATPGDVTVAPGDAPALSVGEAEGGAAATADAAAESNDAAAAEAAAEPPAEAADGTPAEAQPESDDSAPAAQAAEPPTEEPPTEEPATDASESDAAADDEAGHTPSQAEGSGDAAPAEGADTEAAVESAAPARKGRAKKESADAGGDAGAPVADTSAQPAEGAADAAPAEGADTEPPAS
jgi:small subunit ribosomal protein S1